MWVQVFVFMFLICRIGGLNLQYNNGIIFPTLMNNLNYSKNNICKTHSELYRERLDNLTLWAHEMWDASVKYPVGVLRGNIFQMGDWNECITINGPYRTQYCLVTLSADVPAPTIQRNPLSLNYSPFESVLTRIYKVEDISQQSRHSIQIGLCIPALCFPSDLEYSLNEHLANNRQSPLSLNVTYKVKVSPELCQTSTDEKDFNSWDIAFCCLTFILIFLAILSTLYDYYHNEETNLPKKLNEKTFTRKMYVSFSVRNNFFDLPKADESNPALRILYGLKTFSIFMIIMDHRFGTFLSGPIMNTDYIEKEYRSYYAAFIFHGDLFVDTFFVLSGLLVTYGLLVQFNKKILNPVFLIFLRYIRLTPVYAFVILYYTSIFNHMGSGPFWKQIIEPEVADCRANWWTNLLYINNYVNDKHMCMVHAWYLPCDLHFFIVGIFVVLLIHKRKSVGFAVLTFIFMLSIIIPFALTVIHLRPALVQFYIPILRAPKSNIDFRLTYTKSHTRAVSYIVGMFVGYIYYRLKDTSKRLSPISSHVLTFISVIILFATVATGTIFYDRYHKYSAIEAGTYAALHRVAWGIGTAGILFSASYGHATILRSVLSWSPWVSLSKLVYGAYLVHMIFQFRSVAATKSPRYFTYFDVISLALGDIVLAFISALFLYLGIEAPLRKIFKELLTSSTASAKKSITQPIRDNDAAANNHNHDSRL